MKSMIQRAVFVLAFLPLVVQADIASDMRDANMSLVQVVQNALAEGNDIGAVVAAMIRLDPSQSNSIIATAMVVQPTAFASIITASINAGVPANDVVTVALVASGGRNSGAITSAAVNAAPASEAVAIRAAAGRALAQGGDSGSAATDAPALVATRATGSGGGGAASTAEEIQTVLVSREAATAAVAAIRTQLTAAGFTNTDINAALDEVTESLQEKETNLTQVVESLNGLVTQINAGATTQEILAGINDTISSASGEGPNG